MHIYRATFLTLLLSYHIHAIEVTPNSVCSFLCDDSATADPGDPESSHTRSNNLVCDDDEFSSTVVGRKFKECLICELNDTATYPPEKYAYWHVWNMKYNVDWCVFGYPNNPQITEANSQCGDVCSDSDNSTRLALVDHLVKNHPYDALQYCQNENGAFSKTVDDCMKCLNELPNAKTLANFVKALKAACDQQPQPGENLKLDFDVFAAVSTQNSSTSTASSTSIVTVSVTPANPSTSSSATVAVTSANPPTSSSAALAAPSSSRAVASASAAAPANDRVGVGVGVGIGGAALVLAMTAIILFRRRSKHNREVIEGEARVRREAERLAAHGVPNSSHQPQREQIVGVPELIAPDYSAGVAELSAPDYSAEADGRRLDPELDVKIQR
ncbi:hypothetical protein MMC07_005470 [Pseudocyphellaria aurata]|nr:hypothetical protein [Pseudocyphellaria aurata]